MKKLALLLCVIAITFSSCSSDDSSSDPIIGTWKYYKLFINGVEQDISACDQEETFTFNSDGTIMYQFFEENGDGECLPEESFTATWTNDGNNVYTLTVGEEMSSQNIEFENNTFYFEYTEIDDPSDPVTTTYREVYIRN